jgi:amidase
VNNAVRKLVEVSLTVLSMPLFLSTLSVDRASAFNLQEASIRSINEAFSSGILTSEELTKLYLNRIAAYDSAGPRINSIVAVNPNALDIARALDLERRTTGPRSMLHGIPIVLKDNIDTFDLPTTGGSVALRGSVPSDDAFVV